MSASNEKCVSCQKEIKDQVVRYGKTIRREFVEGDKCFKCKVSTKSLCFDCDDECVYCEKTFCINCLADDEYCTNCYKCECGKEREIKCGCCDKALCNDCTEQTCGWGPGTSKCVEPICKQCAKGWQNCEECTIWSAHLGGNHTNPVKWSLHVNSLE